MKTPKNYTSDFVTSTDGTKILYRKLGSGKGLILVHGGMRSAQSFLKLAYFLSDSFTVYIPDRRGRGLSGDYGDNYSIQCEIEDLQALIKKTDTNYIFGLSAGALITLKTTLETDNVKKAALYEPALSINNSVPTDWLQQYERELNRRKPAKAVVTAMKGLRIEPILDKIPRFILVPLLSIVMKIQGDTKAGNVTMRSLAPTLLNDMKNIKELNNTIQDYKNLKTPILLMGGDKSPSYLKESLIEINKTLANAKLQMFPSLSHGSPEEEGAELVSIELKKFFGECI